MQRTRVGVVHCQSTRPEPSANSTGRMDLRRIVRNFARENTGNFTLFWL